MVQAAAGASVLEPVGQLLVCEKSPVLVPVMAMLLKLSAAEPLFVRVTVWAELDVPRICLPKLRLVGFRPAQGPLQLMKLLRIFVVVCWMPALAAVLP